MVNISVNNWNKLKVIFKKEGTLKTITELETLIENPTILLGPIGVGI